MTTILGALIVLGFFGLAALLGVACGVWYSRR